MTSMLLRSCVHSEIARVDSTDGKPVERRSIEDR